MNSICLACNKFKKSPIIEHHVSYYPELKIPIHRSCHSKIHRGDKYQHLLPDARQVVRFYKIHQRDKHVNQSQGYGKMVASFFNYIEGGVRFYQA